MSIVFRNSFYSDTLYFKLLHCFCHKGWRFEGLVFSFCLSPRGFLLHSLWLCLKASSMKPALSFSRKCPKTWSEGGEKVGFLAWLPNLFEQHYLESEAAFEYQEYLHNFTCMQNNSVLNVLQVFCVF